MAAAAPPPEKAAGSTFQDSVEKIILTEGVSDAPHYPTFADVVTVEISDAAQVTSYRTWVIGTGTPVDINGLDLDRCVKTMRRGEKCKVKAKGGDTPAPCTLLWLLAHERAEDFLSNGRLVRFTIQEGGGWATPSSTSEVQIRYSWRTVPRLAHAEAAVFPDPDGACIEATLAPFTGSAAATVLDRDMLMMRRMLMRSHGPPMVWRRKDGDASGASYPGGPLLSIARAGQTFVSADEGIPCKEAVPILKAALASLESLAPVRSEVQETTVHIEGGSCSCAATDFLVGNLGLRVLVDMHVGQISMVRVSPELAASIPGLQEKGVPSTAVVEYDIEVLNIMSVEDVSLLGDGGLMKKSLKHGESYEKIVEGAKVQVNLSVRDSVSGAVILEERQVNFEAASGEYCFALDEVILKLKPQEVAEVRCVDSCLCVDKQLGIDKEMSTSKPTLRIEVLDVEKVELFINDESARVVHCSKRKEVGTRFFQAGDWRRALLRYNFITHTLSYLEHWEDDKARADAVALRRVAHLNAAMCHLKLEAWKDAALACEAVLTEDPDNVKALFRKGQALNNLAEYRDAESSFRKCLELDKDNKEVARMILKVRQSLKTQAEKQKLMFSKMAKSLGSEEEASGPPSSEQVTAQEAPNVS